MVRDCARWCSSSSDTADFRPGLGGEVHRSGGPWESAGKGEGGGEEGEGDAKNIRFDLMWFGPSDKKGKGPGKGVSYNECVRKARIVQIAEERL